MILAALLLLAADPPTLHQRVEQRLAAEPALAARGGRVDEERGRLGWLVGGWSVLAVVGGRPGGREGFSYVTNVLSGTWLQIRTIQANYPRGREDLQFIGYDPAGRRWVLVLMDNHGNANRLHAASWENGRAVFEGDVVMLGMSARLRQTIQREGEDEYTITSEERIGNRWRHLDTTRYRRRPVN